MERKSGPSLRPQQSHSSLTMEEIAEFRSIEDRDRKVIDVIYEAFGVKTQFGSNGKPKARCYPYPQGYNIRLLPKIDFYWVGGARTGLFGKALFQSGGKRLVITTGEEDTLAVAQAFYSNYDGKIYPVVSPGSDQNINKTLVADREWIRTFKEVILMFDEDESGRAALAEAIKIIGIDKVKITKMPTDCKDASDVLVKHNYKKLMQIIFDAQPYTPGGFLGKDELWERLEEDSKIQSMEFPPCLSGVNKKTKGKRYGDITLFISGTGSGKSTLIREDALYTKEHHLAPDERIGWIALEEGPGESVRKFSAMALMRNPAAQTEPITLEEYKPGFEAVFGTDQILVLDHQGSMNDAGLMEKMEWLCLKGCRHIYLDHITIAASEGFEGTEGNEAVDKLMAAMLRLVKRYPVWIGLIAHLRKVPGGTKAFEEGKLPSMDDIKGSGSIKQISMDIIAFARNMRHADEDIRNKIKMDVLKCRFTGLTGPVQGAKYDFETGRLNLDTHFEEEE